jgi:hypothetical protein
MNPIPGYVIHPLGGSWEYCKAPGPDCRWFDPPCYDPVSEHPKDLGQGICSGEWLTNITFYDQLRIPDHLEPGEYVLGFRYDCEASAQVPCLTCQACLLQKFPSKIHVVTRCLSIGTFTSADLAVLRRCDHHSVSLRKHCIEAGAARPGYLAMFFFCLLMSVCQWWCVVCLEL